MNKDWKPSSEMFSNWPGYIWAMWLVGLVTLVGEFASKVFYLENVLTFYLLVVVISAIYWGLGPSIVASIATIIAMDYFFIQPLMDFFPISLQDTVTLITLLTVSILISYLASRFRQKSAEALHREREINSLYNLSRDLAKSTELDPSIKTILQIGPPMLGNDMTLFLPDPQNRVYLIPYYSGKDFVVGAMDFSAAQWSFQNRQRAGQGTKFFPELKQRFLPLITPRRPVGVLSLGDNKNEVALTEEQERLLTAFTELVAVCLENIKLVEETNKAKVLKAKEELQTTILNSLSHDLRTPLVSIIGALSSLQDGALGLDDNARCNMVQVARDDAERLNGMIANLLDISRLETGAMKLLKQPSDVADLIGVALQRLQNRTPDKQIQINIPTELPLIEVDSNLIVQVLYNVLDNAYKYSPADSSIEISARQAGSSMEIEIADHGIGIPQSDLPFVFNKFYRVRRQDNILGIGLGLSICKGIVEAHGGHIEAENRLGGGTIIKIVLPINNISAINQVKEYDREPSTYIGH